MWPAMLCDHMFPSRNAHNYPDGTHRWLRSDVVEAHVPAGRALSIAPASSQMIVGGWLQSLCAMVEIIASFMPSLSSQDLRKMTATTASAS